MSGKQLMDTYNNRLLATDVDSYSEGSTIRKKTKPYSYYMHVNKIRFQISNILSNISRFLGEFQEFFRVFTNIHSILIKRLLTENRSEINVSTSE